MYSVGRVAGWIVEAAIIYLVLAFPPGGSERADRALVLAGALLVGLLYLPTALLADHFPSPSRSVTCDASLPGERFVLVDAAPAWCSTA